MIGFVILVQVAFANISTFRVTIFDFGKATDLKYVYNMCPSIMFFLYIAS